MSIPQNLTLRSLTEGLTGTDLQNRNAALRLRCLEAADELQESVINATMRRAKVGENRALLASEQRDVNDARAEMTRLRDYAAELKAAAPSDPFEGHDGISRDGRHRLEHLEKVADLTEDERNAQFEEQQRRTPSPVPGRNDDENSTRDGVPLARSASFRDWVHTRSAQDRNAWNTGDRGLDAGRYLRGLFTGDWSGADAERRAMAEGTLATGGYAVPSTIAAQIVDLARNKTRVLQAGATLVPMASRVVNVPVWAGDVTPAWRAENAPVVEDDAALGSVRLSARSLAAITKASLELMQDSTAQLEQALLESTAARFAVSVDYAALYGDGTPSPANGDPLALADSPVGVKNTTGVTKTALATNGAALTYDHLIDGIGRRADANEDVTAAIMSPRSLRTLAKAKDTAGNYLRVPEVLADVPRLDSNQVPNNLTQGTGTNTSDVFLGDWSRLLIGVRTDLQIIPLKERYADNGQLGFLFWWRGDVAVSRPSAFEVLTGALAG